MWICTKETKSNKLFFERSWKKIKSQIMCIVCVLYLPFNWSSAKDVRLDIERSEKKWREMTWSDGLCTCDVSPVAMFCFPGSSISEGQSPSIITLETFDQSDDWRWPTPWPTSRPNPITLNTTRRWVVNFNFRFLLNSCFVYSTCRLGEKKYGQRGVNWEGW